MPDPQTLLPLLTCALALILCAAVPQAAPPDYNRLALKGDGHAQDHFSLSIQAAARLLDRDLDYETLFILSGNAFAPCLDPTENCAAWWVSEMGRDTNIDLISRRLGLEFRRIPGPAARIAPLIPPEGPARDQWLRDSWRKPAVPLIRDAQHRGEVVLTNRAWSGRGPHGFTPWGWWGVIVEAREDASVTGATLNGFLDNPLDGVGNMLAISPGAPRIGQAEADFRVLCHAVSRINGSARPFLPRAQAVFGLSAVDHWIARMEQVPFCEACGDHSDGCACDTARPTYEGARVAARYLSSLAQGFPAESRPHLQAAAGCYQRIADLLRPALTGEGGERYQDFIGDLARQQAHVAGVLKPLRAQLKQAAREMERALAASVPPDAQLLDVPPGRGDGHAFGRGLQVLLAHEGVDADYHTLMGDLGLAFITQASPEAARFGGAIDVGWWPLDPSCCSAFLGFAGQAIGRHLESWGGTATWRPAADEGADSIAQIRVAHALDSGRPVVANHDFWKVVTQCDQEDLPLLGFHPCGQGTDPARLPGPAWEFAVAGEAIPKLDRNQADIQALRHAVALARDQVPMPGGYLTGQAAYALWAAALRDLEHLGEARWHANMVLHLSLSRPSAPVYLEQMANRHPEPVASHLLAAAGIYREALKLLSRANTSPAAIAAPEGRETLAQLVEQIAKTELGAVRELEAALVAAGED